MVPTPSRQEVLQGIGFALLATLLWSGNFIIARGIINQVPPISLAFLRWATATTLLLPLAWPRVVADWKEIKRSPRYFIWTALTGIAIFNTLVYVAGHYTSAINLALIGTTSSPVFALILAALFLGERVSKMRLLGMLLSFSGIILLLSKGSWQVLANFKFGVGDVWVLVGAFCFALYTLQIRRKPSGLHHLSLLWILFAAGTLMLLPAFIWERNQHPPINWTWRLGWVVLYLGLGASVIAFLIWNLAIARLGVGRTALFGNLIPLFSTIEAVVILAEPVLPIHGWSGLLILSGLAVANSAKPAA